MTWLAAENNIMPNSITVYYGAGVADITIHMDSGEQVFDLMPLTRIHRDGVRERVVDYWCKMREFRPMYRE